MSMPPSPDRIIIIDDSAAIHDDIRKILGGSPAGSTTTLTDLASSIFGGVTAQPKSECFLIDSALQGEEGYARVLEAVQSGTPYALAFVDMRMPPGWDGLETVQHLIKADPRLQIVICTAFADHGWNALHEQLGACDNILILKKPFDHIEVLQLAHTLCKKWRVQLTLESRIKDLDHLAARRTQELYRAEELFAQAFSASPLAQCIQSLDTGIIVEVNPSYERVMQVSRQSVIDCTPDSFGRGIDAGQWCSMLNRLAQGETLEDIPFAYCPDNGSPREMRCSGRAIFLGNLRCAIWVIRDVTEQIHLEQQLRQSQKMEAIGQLVSGVAHDFNNLLTIILNYAGFSLDQPGLNRATFDYMSKVRGAAERAAALTRQLLVFSRQQLPNPLPLDLSEVVLSFREMLIRLIPARIELCWDCPAGLPIVRADAANVEQVVLNLLVNARDAIAREGRISLSVSEHVQPVTGNVERAPGLYLKISVADTGNGIPPEVMSRIFDPFFTTKDVGKGTGMGLATIDSIAKQHRGWVDVSSTLGKGSCFAVYFPADPDCPAPAARVQPSSAQQILANLRVLYVEDDPIVRAATQIILAKSCRRLEVATDGASALSAWHSSSGEFDLLITDMVMPGGISGADLTRRFSAENPRLKTLIASGYSSELLAQSESLSADLHVLTKPYDRESLMAAIHQAMTGNGRSQASAEAIADTSAR